MGQGNPGGQHQAGVTSAATNRLICAAQGRRRPRNETAGTLECTTIQSEAWSHEAGIAGQVPGPVSEIAG